MITNNLAPVIYLRTVKGRDFGSIVTNFSYKFSEKDDDVCEFTIETDNPYTCDDEDLQEGQQLIVQWGYLQGALSKMRKIYIFDIDPDYHEQGITIKFTCHEKFVLAKMDVASTKNIKQLSLDTPILFSSEVLTNVKLEIERGNPALQRLLDDNNVSTTNQFPEKVNDYKLVSYYNGNYTSFKGLKNFFNKFPGGPYVIDSRDDGVIIRTRDFSQDPIMTYSYNRDKGNPLLKFKPETKNRSKSSASESVSVTSWDHAKKEAITQTSTSSDKGQIKLADKIAFKPSQLWEMDRVDALASPEELQRRNTARAANAQYGKTAKTVSEMGGIPVETKPKEQLSDLQKKIRAGKTVNTGKDYDSLKDKYSISEGKLPNGQKVTKKYVSTDYGKRAAIRGVTSAVDNTAVFKRVSEIIVDQPAGKKLVSAEDHERAGAFADNLRKDSEMDTNPATCSMIGEPSIECGKLITIEGVSNKHAGNYYIKDCEHTIDSSSGYLTTCSKMGRQGVNKIKEVINKTPSNLPSNQYMYELNKKGGLEFVDGNYINKQIGTTEPANIPKTVEIPVIKAERG